MKRAVSFVLALLLLPAIAVGGGLPTKYRASISETGAGLSRGLTFHAPFTDPSNPLTIYKGTGPFTFTRAHDATHTATFIHPTTGLVTTASADQLRIEANGALVEGARTNIALYSDNLVDAAWVKVNMDAAMDQVGPDGVANSASLITATDNDATILQTVLSLSAAHSYAVWMKRVSGAGAVSVTIDGTTWTAKTITSSWSRVSKEGVTVLNPVIGIKLAVSGDTVAVALNQLEVAAFSSSSIPTEDASASRNADLLSFPSAGNISGTLASVAVYVDTQDIANAGNSATVLFSAADPVVMYRSSKYFLMFDGTNFNYSAGAVIWNDTNVHGLPFRWGGSNMSFVDSDGAVVTSSFDGDMNLGITMYLGSYGGSGRDLWGHLKNLRIWNRLLSDSGIKVFWR